MFCPQLANLLQLFCIPLYVILVYNVFVCDNVIKRESMITLRYFLLLRDEARDLSKQMHRVANRPSSHSFHVPPNMLIIVIVFTFVCFITMLWFWITPQIFWVLVDVIVYVDDSLSRVGFIRSIFLFHYRVSSYDKYLVNTLDET